MADPFATSYDVAARWRPLSDAEAATADVLVGDASALIRARFPGIDAQVDAGTTDPNVLTMVVAGMVKRAMIAPSDGVAQDSETAGPFSHSQTFANPMGNVFITAAELMLIRGYRPTGGTYAYGNTTIQPSPDSDFGYVYGR